MKRKASSRNLVVTILLRILPLVLLPLLVGILHPDGGSGGYWKMVFASAACGAVISAAVPSLRFAILAVAIVTVLLLSVSYTEVLHEHLGSLNEPSASSARIPVSPRMPPVAADPIIAGDGPVADPVARKRDAAERVAAFRWRPAPPKVEAPVEMSSFSVVLPCAFEGEFAEKTVWAVWENTDKNVLKEIIVVDDGSRPPLRKIMSEQLLTGGPGVPKMKIVRHEHTLGLISAKKSGGDAATGDVIVFFDCHVSPRKGWEMAFLKQMRRKQDHRTIVVPTITSLNPDTWKEIPGGGGGKVCFILWNNDFTWLYNPGRDAPLMSGGLLALSRRWWEETGGYDTKMVAWGGENIDQSLRSWLCGGRIEVADGAYVAHMWRDPKNPKTVLRYPIPTKDVMRNKARAATAWFGDFTEKVMTFPEYEMFTKNGESIGDMSEFTQLKERLSCAPFTSYLDRFSYIYLDGGLIPDQVFQLREKKTGLCLHVKRNDRPPHNIVLAACAGHHDLHQSSELQLFHRGNRDASKRGKPCCSGIMHWNFLQCLDAQRVGMGVSTFECEIGGSSAHQNVRLSEEGQLLWNWKGAWSGAQGCFAPQAPKVGLAIVTSPDLCGAMVEAIGESTYPGDSGVPVPSAFHLKSREVGGGCAAAGTKETSGESASNMELHFRPCDAQDTAQVFKTRPRVGGFEIRAGDTDYCLDSGGGTQVLVYPCYDEKAHNMNQLWKIRAARLLWESSTGNPICVDSKMIKEKVTPPQGEYRLVTCAPKPGQRLKREDVDSRDTFFLKDQDDGRCLSALSGNVLGLSECTHQQRWRIKSTAQGPGPPVTQIQHEASKLCIDAGGEHKPILYPCHTGRVNQPQKFAYLEDPGWIQSPLTWGDNGRRRTFELCLDRLPVPMENVAIQDCQKTRAMGVEWERLNAFVPLERRLWEESAKPPQGTPILGVEAKAVTGERCTVLRCYPAHGGQVVQTEPGRFDIGHGACIWDEEFSICLDLTAQDFQDAMLRFEVLSLESGWLGEVERPVASGAVKLTSLHCCPGHVHPSLRLPLKRSSRGTVDSSEGRVSNGPIELHMGLYVVAPADGVPEADWMTKIIVPWSSLVKPVISPQRLEQVKPLPKRSCLEFTLVALKDLEIAWKGLCVDDLLLDLQFRIEARGDVDELVILEDGDIAEVSSKWHEIYAAPDGKACIQHPRTYTFDLDLPACCASALLQIQVFLKRRDARDSADPKEVFGAEACLPLARGWPRRSKIEDGPFRLPLESSALGHFGQVPLFPLNAAMDVGSLGAGLESSSIPGTLGSMKCSYSLSSRSTKEDSENQAVEDLSESTEAEMEVHEEESSPMRTKTAASHTHDFGYQKWETFVQEMEAKPSLKSGGGGAFIAPSEAARDEDEDEDFFEDMHHYPAPSVTTNLVERLEEATGSCFVLQLYVHDLHLRHHVEGHDTEMDLEVLLGSNVALNFRSEGRRRQSLQRHFHETKVLPIELPRHSRFELRLRNAAQEVLGSTVIDLQDRLLLDHFRQQEDITECRQLWCHMCSVGSLQIALRLAREVAQQETKLWPIPHKLLRAELRVILHEVEFSAPIDAKEVIAAIELEMPQERFHHYRRPSPQWSDVRPGLTSKRISFEWRYALPLKTIFASTEKHVLISIFDADTWHLLGTSMFYVDEALSKVREGRKYEKASRHPRIPVNSPGSSSIQGYLSISAYGLHKSLADEFPVRSGREKGVAPATPADSQTVSEQEVCAQQLVCHPPAKTCLGHMGPPRRRRSSRRPRRWCFLAAFLLALAALATAALRKDDGRGHCGPTVEPVETRSSTELVCFY
eukprot:symbB.v1.2.001426.t1/scaffold34.1/size402451/7